MSLLLVANLPKAKIFRHAMKLKTRANPDTCRGLLTNLLNAKDPVDIITRAIHDLDNFNDTLREAMSSGHHGVVVLVGSHFPIRMVFGDEDDFAWAQANQDQIRVRMAQAVMNALNMRDLRCSVLLFSEHGFDGEYLPVVVARDLKLNGGVIFTADGEVVEKLP